MQAIHLKRSNQTLVLAITSVDLHRLEFRIHYIDESSNKDDLGNISPHSLQHLLITFGRDLKFLFSFLCLNYKKKKLELKVGCIINVSC